MLWLCRFVWCFEALRAAPTRFYEALACYAGGTAGGGETSRLPLSEKRFLPLVFRVMIGR